MVCDLHLNEDTTGCFFTSTVIKMDKWENISEKHMLLLNHNHKQAKKTLRKKLPTVEGYTASYRATIKSTFHKQLQINCNFVKCLVEKCSCTIK